MGLGVAQVPEASMTARAVIRSSVPSAPRYVHGEGLLLAVGVHDTVAAEAGDASDAGAEADLVAKDVGQRLEVMLRPVAAGRVGRTVRADPAGGGQELLGGRVDHLGPGGKEPHVAPLTHSGTCGVTGLQNQGFQAPLNEVCGGGQADRAGPDDHDGQGFGGHLGDRLSHGDSPVCFDICRWLAVAA